MDKRSPAPPAVGLAAPAPQGARAEEGQRQGPLEAEEDREFRRLLVEGLQLGSQSMPVAGNGLSSFLQPTVNEDTDMSGGAVIDPALSAM